MPTFFKVLMHILYFVFVAVAELLVGYWLSPLIGGGWTTLVLIVLFVALMMIYAITFWGWRPSPNGGGDFFSDMTDFGSDFF